MASSSTSLRTLQDKNVYLGQEVHDRLGTSQVVGQSAAIRRVLDQVELVAGTDSTVLLLGETGTGKELFATQIHELSARRGRPMVRVNCSAIPNALIERVVRPREGGVHRSARAPGRTFRTCGPLVDLPR